MIVHAQRKEEKSENSLSMLAINAIWSNNDAPQKCTALRATLQVITRRAAASSRTLGGLMVCFVKYSCMLRVMSRRTAVRTCSDAFLWASFRVNYKQGAG